MANDATDADHQSDGRPTSCTPDDLVDLIRAVKFAHPDMSARNVHREISVAMAAADHSYSFLADVTLNDVKKVWKRALKSMGPPGAPPPPVPADQKPAARPTGDEPVVPAEGVIKFYTVGDGSVKTLAESYANHHAEAAAKACQQQNSEADKEKGKFTHFFLDVPADLSGSRPHQALINFKDNHKTDKGKTKGKRRGKANSINENGRDIFKIQLALPPPGMEDMTLPLLLYNESRTAKTFLHPPTSSNDEDDDGGYFKIRKFITEAGTSGALGATGGQKAYFYGFVTKTKSELDVVSIDICSGLAPAQTW